jgi:hypothetical protein
MKRRGERRDMRVLEGRLRFDERVRRERRDREKILERKLG